MSQSVFSRQSRSSSTASLLLQFFDLSTAVANEMGKDTRCPLARFAPGIDITDHKGILISPCSAEEVLAGGPSAKQPLKASFFSWLQAGVPQLRCLVKQLEKGEASVVNLKKNLERLLDPEDELSDIRSDFVPSEVRDWLASTFTRQRGIMLRRNEDKPRFRSIVHEKSLLAFEGLEKESSLPPSAGWKKREI
ncbi:unnamed protein product [Pleuronectes platessa]|uniref:PDE1 N-terminal domain-containing protein n=1 Tax=Pleuronectes platessa TaxID=8262 RepID=A0A9N7Z2Z9_PLEPL|nr:unnamed protein product [Pleuronectes platessa]